MISDYSNFRKQIVFQEKINPCYLLVMLLKIGEIPEILGFQSRTDEDSIILESENLSIFK
jgi:hypothetical protein